MLGWKVLECDAHSGNWDISLQMTTQLIPTETVGLLFTNARICSAAFESWSWQMGTAASNIFLSPLWGKLAQSWPVNSCLSDLYRQQWMEFLQRMCHLLACFTCWADVHQLSKHLLRSILIIASLRQVTFQQWNIWACFQAVVFGCHCAKKALRVLFRDLSNILCIVVSNRV